MNTVHALLVGVDAYKAGISPLKGCLNDQRAFRNYLVRQYKKDKFHLKLSELSDHAATRATIIKSFERFNEAKDGDVCLFYFSGHGSRIPAPQFWEAFDGFNQCIICSDSNMHDASNDIIDKELSWLIRYATAGKRVHFLSVMDCCHSGTNTRNNDFINIKQIRCRQDHKLLQTYIGHKDYLPNGLGKWSAPKACHISFAACRNDQTAKEIYTDGLVRGAFTTSLLEVLETINEPLSYADLESAITQKIRSHTFGQLPLVDPVAGADPQAVFLNGAMTAKKRFFIGWNTFGNHWELNAGRLQGISEHTSLKTSAMNDTVDEITIEKILLDKSIVTGMEQTDRTMQLETIIQQGEYKKREVSISMIADNSKKEILKKTFIQRGCLHASLNEESGKCEFCVQLIDDKYSLCYAGSDQPLFFGVNATNDFILAIEFWDKVEAVLQWQHLLNLDNPFTGIHSNEYKLELWRSEGKDWTNFNNYIPVADYQHPASFCWKVDDERFLAPGYALKISNTGSRDLYFSALHLSGRYGIDNRYLPIEKIVPQKEAWLTQTDIHGNTYKVIGLNIDDNHWKARVTELTDYIKIFISLNEFSTLSLNQFSLNLIETPASRTICLNNSKNYDNAEFNSMYKNDWTAQCIPLHIVKPFLMES